MSGYIIRVQNKYKEHELKITFAKFNISDPPLRTCLSSSASLISIAVFRKGAALLFSTHEPAGHKQAPRLNVNKNTQGHCPSAHSC
jgi:hypothetical protein